MSEANPYAAAIEVLEAELASILARAEAIHAAIERLRADDPNAPHCSKCGSVHNRVGQRYCHDCHAAANREWRAKRGAITGE